MNLIDDTRVPVKLWTDISTVESQALQQLKNIANLPWAFHHVAVMPDVHYGKGATVGSVIAMKDAISPAAVGVDIGCFTGDTRVRCVDGKSRTLAEMLDTEHWIFANDGKRIVPAKGTTKKTRSSAELVSVVLDTGENIRCTPDHEFMLRDGSYKRADQLEYGTSLMPFYWKQDELGYVRIKQTDTGRWRTGHWLVADAGAIGPVQQFAGQKTIIHHKNFDASDNRPENLQFMGTTDHSSYHRSLAERNTYWQSPEFEKARIEGIRKMASTPEGREFLAKRGTANITRYMSEHRDEFLSKVAGNGKRGQKFLVARNKSEKGRTRSRELANRLYTCAECDEQVRSPIGMMNHRKSVHGLTGPFNHTVQRVERLQEREDVYCMSVPGLNNFALDAGVFVHNCGMSAVRTSLTSKDLPDDLGTLRSAVERDIPVGFNSHKDERGYHALTTNEQVFYSSHMLQFFKLDETVTKDGTDRVLAQLGTLGGGNHFIEMCLDEEDRVWLTLHSGSRNVGKRLAEVHIARARALIHNAELPDPDLAVFLAGTEEMRRYVHDLKWAQTYALMNRVAMLHLYKGVVTRMFPHATFDPEISCHHNYVSEETHFGENVLVTRKGAISAKLGQMGLIPGSMGAKSYVVSGLANPDAFCSASHGAGRRMSRGAAKRAFKVADLEMQTLGVECRKDEGVLDEIPAAYKDIDVVMENQRDLVKVEHVLHGVMCVKG